jgi:hypothetical protein
MFMNNKIFHVHMHAAITFIVDSIILGAEFNQGIQKEKISTILITVVNNLLLIVSDMLCH